MTRNTKEQPTNNYKLISSDSHVYEPYDLWTSRIEPKFVDRAPHIEHLESSDYWFCDGSKVIGTGSGSQTGTRFEDADSLTLQKRFQDVRPGGYIPEEHIKDMELDGVYANVLFPTVGLLLYSVPDSELLTAIFRVYNDWVAEFCKSYPSRLKGVCVINVDDVPTGVKELERCANIGLKGALITVYPPEGREYFLPEYEPLWTTAEALDMPLGLHVATNRPGAGQEFMNASTDLRPAFLTNVDHWVRMSLADMIFSGVFERHPKLKVGTVEHEFGWLPHFMERLDYNYTERPRRDDWPRFKEDMMPSDYLRRNIFVSFQEDPVGIQHRDYIGIDILMWGSDYPHIESTFPKSREILEEILADCAQEEKVKIAGGNAARVFQID